MKWGLLLVTMLLAACTTNGRQSTPLEVVPAVDLSRYIGKWYEIASFPQRFQKDCTDSRAEYRIRPDGVVEVLNSCLRDGKIDSVKGRAWVVDKKTNAKLKVSFFWPFRGDYWIIDLGKDYEYAVVSAPSMNYLWVLSRTPQMDEQRYQQIVGRLKDRGFDIARLNRTQQGNRKD
ncbi:MAG TPA: lipocalin family protein [Nitrospirota bacterium]